MNEEILQKIQRYCAYQERCRSEVRARMHQLGASEEQVDQLLAYLEKEQFLDEARFARAFARGKFTYNKWGRQKIRHGLREKQVPDEMIEEALREEIDPETYEIALRKLIQRKWQSDGDRPQDVLEARALQTFMKKGYEAEEIRRIMDYLAREQENA